MISWLCPYCGVTTIVPPAPACSGCQATGNDKPSDGVTAPQESSSNGLFAKRLSADNSQLSDVQRWYLGSRRTVPLHHLRELLEAARPLGMFNTEGGAVAVSSRPITYCEDCAPNWDFLADGVCDTCGRSSKNTVLSASGLGDGVYPVWRTKSDVVFSNLCRKLDYFPSLDETIEMMHQSAPLLVSSFSDVGALWIGETGAIAIPTTVVETEFDIFVWIGEAPAVGRGPDLLTPVAISAFPRALSGDILRVAELGLQQTRLIPSGIAAPVWGNPMRTVMANASPAHSIIAAMNSEYLETDDEELAYAWQFQQARHFPDAIPDNASLQATAQLSALSKPEIANPRAWLAMTIGQVDDAISDFRAAAAAGSELAQIVIERIEMGIRRGQPVFPVWGIRDIGAALMRAHWVKKSDPQLALDYLCKAAVLGSANAVSSYTWAALESGDFEAGVRLFEVTRENCESRSESLRELSKSIPLAQRPELNRAIAEHEFQLANSASNAALLRLALDGVTSTAIAVWQANAGSGHLESLFYPALAAARAGDNAAIARVKSELTAAQLAELVEICESVIASVPPGSWTHGWYTDGLAALQSVGDWLPTGVAEATTSSPGTLKRFCTNCGAPTTGGNFCAQCGHRLA